jgi:hypothetical protein
MGNAEVSIRILADMPLKEFVENRFATVERLPIVKTGINYQFDSGFRARSFL